MGHCRGERSGYRNRRLRGLSAVANWRCEYSSDYFDWILRVTDDVLFGSGGSSDFATRTPLGLRRGTYHHYPTCLLGHVRSGDVTRPLIRLVARSHSPALVVPSNVRVHVGPPTSTPTRFPSRRSHGKSHRPIRHHRTNPTPPDKFSLILG